MHHFVPTTISLLVISLHLLRTSSQATPPPTSNGYNCSSDRSIYPCQAYALYRAGADPTLLDLASVGDLFGVSRLSLARASNLTATSPLVPGQPLLVPLTCACSSNLSYFPVSYRIAPGDTYYLVSSKNFGNLTSYPVVEVVNPSLVPTNLSVGVDVVFPIFCQCPTTKNGSLAIVTYSFQVGDTFASIASEFGTDVQSLVSLNGKEASVQAYTTILVPVSRIPPPVITQAVVAQPPSTASVPPSTVSAESGNGRRKGVVVGLAVALGIIGLLWLVSLLGLLLVWQRRRRWEEERGKRSNKYRGGGGGGGGGGERRFERSTSDDKLMADISEWLDKYKVYRIEELMEATGGFSEGSLIQGSVYKGLMDGEVYAIKKMKWNARDELKILQKVNHTNLVKLEGFCIEPDAGTCYLIYEYIENGSLHSWLHDRGRAHKLDWRARLRIALDLAHGLQYIHEHTWPRVVHKDIKSSNVLLDSKMRAKVANFGLAKSGCNAVTTHIVGTQGYVAPEYLVDGLVTTKMDVFAYGVVLLELVSGREAVSEGEILWMEVEGIFENKDGRVEGRIMAWMDKALMMGEQSMSMDSVVNVMHIARACLQKDPAKRPSMVDVAYTLSKADELFSDFSEDGLMVGSGDIVAR
ncbi:putative lysM domain receptor-like kinase 4 [Iris pallida]|uniref:LysM domain receptor-like kinase 4 n=1 Tax=Iris pallida TaxID=29817 RepID=A0AAX6I7Y6_IRIPA|nr:putative lysM domain receptor-like kinase 4 [Iris pallida]